MNLVFSATRTAIDSGAVIVLAGSGELLMERAGMLNLGLEGIVSIGAVSAVIAASSTSNVWACLLAAMAGGALMGLIYAVATVAFRANQVLCGLALVLFGTGLANHLGASFSGKPMGSQFVAWKVPGLSRLGDVGDALFVHDPLVLAAYTVVPLLVAFLLYRTRHGLNLRAVGENPGAADAMGVNVFAMRFVYALIGGAIAGAGGAALSMSFTPGWAPGLVAGSGWIALAVVIFAAWRPGWLVLGAFLFGLMRALSFIGQERGWSLPAPVLNMLPYVLTLLLIAAPAFFKRFRRATTPPAALATPYFREER
jgi:general nucleoside transport system permease protein